MELKIELGKSYVDYDGNIWKIVGKRDYGCFPWIGETKYEEGGSGILCFNDKGFITGSLHNNLRKEYNPLQEEIDNLKVDDLVVIAGSHGVGQYIRFFSHKDEEEEGKVICFYGSDSSKTTHSRLTPCKYIRKATPEDISKAIKGGGTLK